MKERVLHGSTVEIKTALASHCDPRRAGVFLFLLKASKIGIICVTGVLGPHLGQDAAWLLQDCCLKWLSATANEDMCVSHVCVKENRNRVDITLLKDVSIINTRNENTAPYALCRRQQLRKNVLK